MKLKIFFIVSAFMSLPQVSCSSYFSSQLVDTSQKIGESLAKEALQLGKAGFLKLLQATSQELKTLPTPAPVIIKETTGSILSYFTPENIRPWMDLGVGVAIIYSMVVGVDKLFPQENIEATTYKNINHTWGGTLPEEFNEILDSAKHYAALREKGLLCHNGYLFHGPPGTGKTFLVKILSEKLGIPLIETNSGQFLSKYQGSANTKLTAIIKKARSCRSMFYHVRVKNPFSCIVFIDEIDGLTNTVTIENGEADRFVKDFQAILTDPANNDILFICATNFYEKVGAALKRDGRLVPIQFKLPNEETRKALLITLLAKCRITQDHEFENILKKVKGFSPATLEEMIKRAARNDLLKKLNLKDSSFFAELEKLLTERTQQETQSDALPEGAQLMYM